MGTPSGSGSCSGSSTTIAPSYKRKQPSKLDLGKILGSKTTKGRGSSGDAELSDRHFIENGALLFEALITNCRGNINPIRMFSAKELTDATGNYDEGRFVGKGIWQVYSGIYDGQPIAVKVPQRPNILMDPLFDMFLSEVVSLSQINHRNVVRLLGCCIETQVPILVYDLMSGGTLYQRIRIVDAAHRIPWADRLRIAIEVADALNYLHTAFGTPIIHGNVRSSSIFLDDCCCAKVGSFGFSELVPRKRMGPQKSSVGSGSLDNSLTEDDYGLRLTEKDDVFCFGLVLIELLTGGTQRATLKHFISLTRDNSLGLMLDGSILDDANPEQLMACAWVAIRSITEEAEERPTMKELVKELRRIRG